MSRPYRQALLALLLTTTLCACGKTVPLPPVSPIVLPDDCEGVLRPVPVPPPLKRGEDIRAKLYRVDGALAIANNTIVSGRECVANQRGEYGRP